jgi:hypothetical protein
MRYCVFTESEERQTLATFTALDSYSSFYYVNWCRSCKVFKAMLDLSRR